MFLVTDLHSMKFEVNAGLGSGYPEPDFYPNHVCMRSIFKIYIKFRSQTKIHESYKSKQPGTTSIQSGATSIRPIRTNLEPDCTRIASIFFALGERVDVFIWSTKFKRGKSNEFSKLWRALLALLSEKTDLWLKWAKNQFNLSPILVQRLQNLIQKL